MKRKSYILIAVLCSGLLLMAGTQVFADVTINIALANNPLSQALERIAREKYSAEGVTVNIAVLPENDLRQRLTTEASTGGTTYDMFYIGPCRPKNWNGMIALI